MAGKSLKGLYRSLIYLGSKHPPSKRYRRYKMRYLAAYLLCDLSGYEKITVDDIESILVSVGVQCDRAKAGFLIDKLKGKNIEEVIEEGKDLLAFTAALANEMAAEKTGDPEAEPVEAKEAAPEEKEEETEESDDDLGFGLFD